jgi:hypothetical protein
MKAVAAIPTITLLACFLSAPALAKIARTQAEHVCLEMAKQGAKADRNSATPNSRKRVGFANYSACMRSHGFQP